MKIYIGKRIKYFREQNNITQKDLGKSLNVSDRTIHSWEIDRTEPNMGMVDKMCQIFGCTRSELIGEINPGKINEYSPDQLDVLLMYNKLNDDQKKSVYNLLISMTSGN